MDINQLHEWPDRPHDATSIQNNLKSKIITEGSLSHVHLIAGVDTAFDHKRNLLYSGVTLMRYPEMTEVEKTAASQEALFPLHSGLRAFREGQVVLEALAQLQAVPDLIIFAGHGIAHPNHFGLACHLGLILETPSIGLARKKLVGNHNELDMEKGNQTPLIMGNRQVGVVYRSRTGVKPIFISPGHLCGIEEAVNIVSSCLSEYRLPDPLHFAHRWASFMKRKGNQATKREDNYG